eukprot:TRINITY_DN3016_c0_g1_i4.p1 TRINITY_DN3016_c0_g1~~TRINITY_DN3016_c0_g1_i4.p1  ORF type:complete len:374 (-),score=9.00 TRINITY_DN3016_c0_g1_i4:388-1509(-)
MECSYGFCFQPVGQLVKKQKNFKSGRLRGSKIAHCLRSKDNRFALVSIPLENLFYQCVRYLNCDMVRHVLAGACARTASQVVIHPLDTIKTRQQVQFPNAKLQQWRQLLSQSKQIGRFQIPKAVQPLLKGDIWIGLWGAVLGTLPVGIVYYSVYENVCSQWKKTHFGAGATHLVAAATGGVFSDIFRVPADIIRHRVQAYMYPTVFHAAQDIAQKDGIRGFYRGFGLTLLRDIPELAITFGTYEMLRNYFMDRNEGARLQTWQHLMLGGLSGAIAGMLTNPLDVIKCGMQTAPKSLNMRRMISQMVKNDSGRALMAGMGPRVAQLALQNACLFVMFEYLKSLLKPIHVREPDDRNLRWKLTFKRRTHIWKRQF